MTPNKILGLFGKNNLLLSGLIEIVITIIASSMILSITMEHQSFARCPNGYHISPSGVCEQVIQPSIELPRCPNGYHISPSGVCEQVIQPSNNSPYQNPSTPYQNPSTPYQNPSTPYQNQTSPYLQQPFSQPQQQQQLVQLYNPSQVVACLNNVLAQSIIKAGTLNNNTRGITAGVNSTFMDNATKTLDNCIVPTTTMTR
jgi:hypothetical protein